MDDDDDEDWHREKLTGNKLKSIPITTFVACSLAMMSIFFISRMGMDEPGSLACTPGSIGCYLDSFGLGKTSCEGKGGQIQRRSARYCSEEKRNGLLAFSSIEA
ncbi:hypothetical protein ONS95_000619 [Cadophora gregata]|uniref:uncharacterized protein n=1 Tax=Cadophora gregata TaxID=51156 RepID=UPI0026DAB0E0|nr:uncharacterized protein ONS95_000619 [Cadophora gregata]KAK0125359.1 hypothetical protein ONS96_009207 [Cadophora gregata f. sp. sojae]KAK0128659.1 hypothetical protein ONS95_000619 [Cadophora gregata]